MNGFLMVQLVAFVAFAIFALGALIHAIVQRIFPTWSRGVCAMGAGFIIVVLLLSTVPGRGQHLEFLKRQVMDEVATKAYNGGGTGVESWFKNAMSGLTVDVIVQGTRVEKHFGLVSVGYVETESGWTPVSVGFAGIVCRNFFIVVPSYETPQVSMALEQYGEGNWQLVLRNNDGMQYICVAYPMLNGAETQLCAFDLDAKSFVRIRREKSGLGNRLKKLLNTDKTLVLIPADSTFDICLTFKNGRRYMKKAEIQQIRDEIRVQWIDPK